MIAEQDLDAAGMVTELVARHSHREWYTQQLGATSYGQTHVTRVPSLLWQLEHMEPTGDGDAGPGGGGFGSRPAARLEALDTLRLIDDEAARWVRLLGQDDPGYTGQCVRLVGSLLVSAEWCGRSKPSRDEESRRRRIVCCARHQVEADIRRWWTQARIVTGWESPAWRPDNTCPACHVRGGLRIRLAARSGLCVDCRETWPADGYQELVDHIRRESDAKRANERRGPCWCAWPRERFGLAVMCPRCGSVACRHAVRTPSQSGLVAS